ncbi:MAG: type III pantothenate kinase [Lysobacterales bacterium CG02_land_8_20_14_3_00_62_12]|nr:MAG: type III pantothenate kinase [Xanthomonadales bacterium CG02_land_8_20_14_3_00_62_12]
MNELLIDLGNSRLKWAQGHQGRVVTAMQALDHRAPDFAASFAAVLATLPEPSTLCIAAVASDDLVARVVALCQRPWPRLAPRRASSRRQLGRFVSAYAEPERLGVDRFLAAAAVANSPIGACLVLGCGTALTVDLIDAGGRHLGGLIAPAPDLMCQAVLQRTADVHWQRQGQLTDFASNTEDALHSGVWGAAVGLVQGALRDAVVRLDATPSLVIHGGGAIALAARLPFAVVQRPALVLEGLALWA